LDGRALLRCVRGDRLNKEALSMNGAKPRLRSRVARGWWRDIWLPGKGSRMAHGRSSPTWWSLIFRMLLCDLAKKKIVSRTCASPKCHLSKTGSAL